MLFSREAFKCLYCVFFPLPGVVVTSREMCLCGSVTEIQGETHSCLLQQTGKSSHSILFSSFRTHNTLYAPEMLAKMVEPFTKALDMLEVEKSAILGKTSSLLLLFTLSLTGFSSSLSVPCVSWSQSSHRHLRHSRSIQRKSSEAVCPPRILIPH